MRSTTDRTVRNSLGLWFAMVGAPLAWAVHFMLVWAITEMGCRIGGGRSQISGVSAIHALTLLSSVIALVVIGLSGISAYSWWRRTRQQKLGASDEVYTPIERTQFMGLLGMMFSILFAVVVIYMAVPVFVLPLCDI